MGYATPADVGISDNWYDHVNRGSKEPGTDYKTAFDTNLRMAADGYVAGIDHSPNGAEGRRLTLNLDDGKCVSYIHLQGINAYHGMPVKRGQTSVAWSGASGYGNNWYYDPHVHVTLWERPGMAYADTINFENYVGPEPQKGFLMALSDQQQNEIYEWVRETQTRVRGVHPDADMLQLNYQLSADTRARVRGPKPDIDMLQDILATLNSRTISKSTLAALGVVGVAGVAALVVRVLR
jgi:murein DD-endopeptidase MepM/ murein hydrolase activator NlpD